MTLETRIASVKNEIRARSMDGIERRTHIAPVEARADGDTWRIVGYGFTYDSWSEDLGGFKERIQPGAANEVMAGTPDIRGLINHNPDLLLGRTTAGTMRVTLDGHGAHYEIDPPATTYANDLRVSLDRGDISQSSFAFRVAGGGVQWEEDPESDLLLRTITKFSGLYDMSPVTYPAYAATYSGTSSLVVAERESMAPHGERDEMAAPADVEAEEPMNESGAWRLAAVQRRIRLREIA